IDSQRSLDNIDKVIIPPVQEVLIRDEYREEVIHGINKDLKKTKKDNVKYEKFHKYIDHLQEKNWISNLDILIPYIPKKYLTNLIEYFNQEALVILDEPKRIEERFKNMKDDFNIKFTDLFEVYEVLSSHVDMMYEYKDLVPSIKERLAVLNTALIK